MAVAYTVALVGFAQNESATFESFFSMAARRPPAYRVQDEVMDAQVLVVNADNTQALHLVRYAELPGKVLLIGHHDGGTGWPLQRKPVKLVSVLAALDGLVGARRGAPSKAPPVLPAQGADRHFVATEPFESRKVPLAPAPKLQPKAVESEFPPTRPMVRRSARAAEADGARVSAPPVPMPVLRHAVQAPRPGVIGLTDFGGLDVLPVPRTPASASSRFPSSRSTHDKSKRVDAEIKRGDMLLVAESLVEGRILHKRFKRYDLAIDWSREATQALAMLKAHPYRLVVIDRLNGTPDAYQICRSAKQCKLPNGQAPVVMMFAPSAGSMDRIKAGLAGSDAYLSRSVGEGELYRVLAQHRLVSLDGFEKTNVVF